MHNLMSHCQCKSEQSFRRQRLYIRFLFLSNRCSPDFQSPIVKQIHLSLTHQFQFEYIHGNRLQLEFHYRRTQENLYLKVPALLFRIQSYPYVHTK